MTLFPATPPPRGLVDTASDFHGAMDDSISSSQKTNEDPAPPGSDAGKAIFKIIPENEAAKLAFHQYVDLLKEQGGVPAQRDAKTHARKYTCINSEPVMDAAVTRLMRRFLTDDIASSSPLSSPQSVSRKHDTSPPAESAVEISHGFYYLRLDEPPRNRGRGWVVGSMYDRKPNDLVLCLPSTTTRPVFQIRRQHAVFQLHSTGRICIRPLHSDASVEAHGKRVMREFVFNDPTTAIAIGGLSYSAQYARHAYSPDYPAQQREYLQQLLAAHPNPSILALTPTPSNTDSIKIGQWTVTTGTVGSGAEGRVSIGINHSGTVAAVKRIVVGKERTLVTRVQQKLAMLTEQADQVNEERILRLIEVISDDAKGNNPTADVWFVLTPAAGATLHSIFLGGPFRGAADTRLSKVKNVLVEVLGATAFLHTHGWLHSDLKPTNIGVLDWDKCSVVLLDLDGVQKSPSSGQELPANPGRSGTIGYLSPEREWSGYTELADVWSIGVMASWMMYDKQPWFDTVNPWRTGSPLSGQRRFYQQYEAMLGEIGRIGIAGKCANDIPGSSSQRVG